MSWCFAILLGASIAADTLPFRLIDDDRSKARMIAGIANLFIGILLTGLIFSMLLGLQFGDDFRIEKEDYWEGDIKDGAIYAMIFIFGLVDFCSGIGQIIYAFYEKISESMNAAGFKRASTAGEAVLPMKSSEVHCSNCGKKLAANSSICPECGKPV